MSNLVKLIKLCKVNENISATRSIKRGAWNRHLLLDEENTKTVSPKNTYFDKKGHLKSKFIFYSP